MSWWIVLTKLACGNGLRRLLEMETNGIAPKREQKGLTPQILPTVEGSQGSSRQGAKQQEMEQIDVRK